MVALILKYLGGVFSMINKRILLSNERKCPFECSYCFAELDCYAQQKPRMLTINSLNLESESPVIIYPSCDSELTLDEQNLRILKDIISSHRYPILSFSTKRKLSDSQLDKLATLNQLLKEKESFLKVSVSLSNKNRLGVIEKKASTYQERLETIERIQQKNIISSVNIKPILPFIALDEYFEIVDDFSNYTKFFMLGSLYIDKNTSFGNEVINNYPSWICSRNVSWLPDKPDWLVCENKTLLKDIRDRIISNGALCFDSDISLINKLIINGVK